jgi:uncharacterized membrane protein
MSPPTPAPAPAPSRATRFDAVQINALSHFYRGELGRIMAWRARLDNTTNWAITVSSSIFTVSFTFSQVPHIIFFFNIAIVWVMLWIEARRYRFYDAFRGRVRMLEAHFLVPIISQNNTLLQGDWQRLMCEDLILPSFKISVFEAVARRVKRNYGFIFMIILGAWLTKIFLHAHPDPEDYNSRITSLATFYRALRVGTLPSWLVACVLLGTLLVNVVMIVYVSRQGSGEISEFQSRRQYWRL